VTVNIRKFWIIVLVSNRILIEISNIHTALLSTLTPMSSYCCDQKWLASRTPCRCCLTTNDDKTPEAISSVSHPNISHPDFEKNRILRNKLQIWKQTQSNTPAGWEMLTTTSTITLTMITTMIMCWIINLLTCQRLRWVYAGTSERRGTWSVDQPWPGIPHHRADIQTANSIALQLATIQQTYCDKLTNKQINATDW